MIRGKDGIMLSGGDMVKFEDKVYVFESQMSEHITLRGPKSGVLIRIPNSQVKTVEFISNVVEPAVKKEKETEPKNI